MTGIGLTYGQLDALPEWEQRMYVRCAIEDERRDNEKLHKSLEFIASIWCGPADDPTTEKPVTTRTYRSGGHDITEKKIVDLDFDDRVKKLRAKSRQIMRETGPLVEKMRAEVKAKMKERNG